MKDSGFGGCMSSPTEGFKMGLQLFNRKFLPDY